MTTRREARDDARVGRNPKDAPYYSVPQDQRSDDAKKFGTTLAQDAIDALLICVARENRKQSKILRDAILEYERRHRPRRR